MTCDGDTIQGELLRRRQVGAGDAQLAVRALPEALVAQPHVLRDFVVHLPLSPRNVAEHEKRVLGLQKAPQLPRDARPRRVQRAFDLHAGT